MTTGSFDEPERLVPTRANGTESYLHWVDKLTALPGKPTEDIQAERHQAPIKSFQHPDRDTPADWRPPQ